MELVLAVLKETPIPTILVLAGITFLLLAIVSQFVGLITMGPERKRWAVIIGGGLLVIGLALHVVPSRYHGPPFSTEPPPALHSATAALP